MLLLQGTQTLTVLSNIPLPEQKTQTSLLLLFETGSLYVVVTLLEFYVDQNGLKLTETRLLLSLKYWD